MKTLTDLKTKLRKGIPLKMVYTIWGNSNKLNIVRYVVKTQVNGVYLNENKDETKGSFLEFPKASLLEFTKKGFKFFNAGLRELTKEEKDFISNEPTNKEQEKNDLLTDTNIMFYRRKEYYNKSNFAYLWICGNKNIKGKRLQNGKVLDEAIKGVLSIEYEFI